MERLLNRVKRSRAYMGVSQQTPKPGTRSRLGRYTWDGLRQGAQAEAVKGRSARGWQRLGLPVAYRGWL